MNRIAVDVVSLYEFFSEYGWPPVDLVKMDVEGSEGAALKGMAQLAKKNKQMRLIMEMSHSALRRTNTSTEIVSLPFRNWATLADTS